MTKSANVLQRSKRFLLVYGSQTGQAKAIAEDIAEKAPSHDLEAELHCADEVDKKFNLSNEDLFVLICSTTGEGEAPDNASKFLRRIKKKTLPENFYANLRYSILGLGDTNYTNFCNCPKEFHKRLRELGANTFYEPGWADDGIGLDIVCDPWIEGLWPALSKQKGIVKNDADPINNNETASEKQEKPNDDRKDGPATDDATSVTTAEEATPGLRHSTPPLSVAALSVPTASIPYLSLTWDHESTFTSPNTYHNGCAFPSSSSSVFQAPLKKCWRLTSDDAVKTALDVCVDTRGTPLETYAPGDAFGLVCPNPLPEVDLLLHRLFHPDSLHPDPRPSADTPFVLSLLENSAKVNAEVPQFIPSPVTARYLFSHLLDFRALPKKLVLRSLAENCSREEEKRRLLELSSKQGSKAYDLYLRQAGLGVVDVLCAFPSCAPPLERLVELLPRLQARSYSISSSPLRSKGFVHFVFNIVEMGESEDLVAKPRRGVCTGWLDKLTKDIQKKGQPIFDDVGAELVSSLSVSHLKLLNLPLFTKPNPHFHPPEDLSRPLLMVGPGTGVAPFLGFLQSREKMMEVQQKTCSEVGSTWLFYGCRHKDRDFLYKDEFERLERSGVLTHLVTSFSRDQNSESDGVKAGDKAPAPKYVQHRVHEQSEEVANLLSDSSAMVFVCGDARNMARNVNDAFIDVLMKCRSLTKMAALNHLAEMRDQKRYLQDVWA